MDGLELRQTMIQTLVNSLKQSGEERKEADSGIRFAELTGRIEALRTLLDFLLNVQVDPCSGADDTAKEGPKQGCEECGGECQGHPDSGGEEKEDGKA